MARAQNAAPRIAAWLLAGAVAMGCTEPTAPRASLSVAVLSVPIPGSAFVGGAPNWNTFTVDVLVKNQSDAAAELDSCGPEVEYETPTGQWVADTQMCSLQAGARIQLPPRSERQWRETHIPPSRSATGMPVRVRLLYRYFTVGVAGDADECARSRSS